MVKVRRSEYIRISRTTVKKLFDQNCFGKGSAYLHVLKSGISKEDLDKVEAVLEALVKQKICCKKKKKQSNASELVRTRSQLTGWKYYLNMDRYDKIKEIIKEKGSNSIIPILLML
ncbi:hypothetical protein HYX07_05695 [Candidatus Woesearchaeota archaeon]|nr:hypothetical protein [Candidatus Woesearchaeota archaeon]